MDFVLLFLLFIVGMLTGAYLSHWLYKPVFATLQKAHDEIDAVIADLENLHANLTSQAYQNIAKRNESNGQSKAD